MRQFSSAVYNRMHEHRKLAHNKEIVAKVRCLLGLHSDATIHANTFAVNVVIFHDVLRGMRDLIC